MDRPLEITFHGTQSSPEVETEIREQVDKLERRFEHLIGCRVGVELLHRQHKTGNLYEIHVEMEVPTGKLVVSHAPHHPREKFAQPALQASLRDAFRVAKRRLTDYKRQLAGEVKLHEEAFAGEVAQMYPAEDHGFIRTHEGAQLYFHRNSLINDDFDALEVGDRVHFTEADGDTGPIAYKVWPAGKPS
jgi:cold shock CspA family protein/ribosome-associated translation inhibitor RaiA